MNLYIRNTSLVFRTIFGRSLTIAGTKLYKTSSSDLVSKNSVNPFLFFNDGFKQDISILPFNTNCRCYAKGRDKKKEKGRKIVTVDKDVLAEIIDIENVEEQMQKSIDVMKNDYTKYVSLRSTTGAIESLPIHFEGKDYTLQELAQIVRKNPKTIVLNIINFPQVIPTIVKAIERCGMNLHAQQEGTTVYIPVPKVTRDYRDGLSKSARSLFIKCRDNIKDIQNKHSRNVKKLEKDKNIAVDLVKDIQIVLGNIADKYVVEAEKIHDAKQTELLGKS